MTNIANLIGKIKNELTVGLPFMEGRTKGSLPTEMNLTLNNYGFLKGDDGEYIVMTFKEDDTNFFFGGSVVTEKMKKIDKIVGDAKVELLQSGMEVKFVSKTSDKKRVYIDLEII